MWKNQFFSDLISNHYHIHSLPSHAAFQPLSHTTPYNSPSFDLTYSIWWHYVVIIVPDRLIYKDTGMLYITGGDNTDGLPKGDSEDELLCIALALANRVTCTVLHQVSV